MAIEFRQQNEMIAIAKAGLASDSIVPFYQPKVDLRTRQVVGFEALIRCRRDGQKPLLPGAFAYAFSEPETARNLGSRLRAQVFDDVEAWSKAGIQCGPVAINTCAADYRSDDFAECLLADFEKRGLKPSLIEVEVTEDVFLGNGADHVMRALWHMQKHGVRIALDDFGTGYASLNHLKHFPVNSLKIDQSFVTGIGAIADDTFIVRSVVDLAHNLGLEVIAEGIETFRQREFLRGLGCDTGQGFIFGEGIPACDVPAKVSEFCTDVPVRSGPAELETLFYVSRCSLPIADAETALESIVSAAREKNQSLAITGSLIFTGEFFAQVLEGSHRNIKSLMSSIEGDKRHRDLVICARHPIGERQFADWSLSYTGPSRFISGHVIRLISTQLAWKKKPSPQWIIEIMKEFADIHSVSPDSS